MKKQKVFDFTMVGFRKKIILLLLAIHAHVIGSVYWDRLHCAPDSIQQMTEGTVADIGRFPWLGIVQHSFYVAGKIHYAVTGAILIHPGFAIAAAEDIGKIAPDRITNNTKLILWDTRSNKHVTDVKDYILHPEYTDKLTFATIALLDLIEWADAGVSDWKAPVKPVCLPVTGSGVFEKMYAVKMTDSTGRLEKEIVKMKYVGDQDCEEFYYKAQLTYPKMNPVNPLCAVSEFAKSPCVWDAGTALITRQSWGFWKLLGFAVRGPGCGAPTKFLNMHKYVPWIDAVISQIPYEDAQHTYKLGYRRTNPYELVVYKAGTAVPRHYGNCDRNKGRGNILYKDSQELLLNKNFVQGFYFVVITMMAQFTCAIVHLEVSQQSNAAVWLEHNCHRDAMGLHEGFDRISRERMACFMYFKTAAFIEIRFYFSFKASLDVSVYGFEHEKKYVPNPFKSTQFTTPWWPTPNRLRMGYWTPVHKWWWYM